MMRARVAGVGLVALAMVWLVPGVWAQNTLSGLAGVVKDSEGKAGRRRDG